MTDKTGGPAFPNASIRTKEGIDVWGDGGMTLRDYFAAKTMSSYLARPNLPINVSDEELAFACYDMADAMLKARAKCKS